MDTLEISYRLLNSHEFIGAMAKLDQSKNWESVDAMLSISKANYWIDKELNKAKKAMNKIVHKHAKRQGAEADAEMVRDERGMPVWEDEEAFAKDHEELMNHKFPLKVTKISADEALRAGLSPRELRACSPFIEGLQDLGDDYDREESIRDEETLD